jgi:hypothetical protein
MVILLIAVERSVKKWKPGFQYSSDCRFTKFIAMTLVTSTLEFETSGEK